MSTTYTLGVRIEGNATGLARASKEALKHVKEMGAGVSKEFSRMARAREMLGVRPEREIQREILKTEAAYNRLARSGSLSFNDQRRAAQAMRSEVEKLTNEMGRLTKQQRIMRGFKIAAGVATAGAIAGAVAAPTVRKTIAWDLRMAHQANTAFNDRDTAGRVAGRRELDASISDAVRFGGGTRESAADAQEALLGAGIFKPGEVKTILGQAVMAATANNADPTAFAQMAISANQTMGIKPEQMGRIFGMGTYAGQSGGFEIKDMAKWLPQQMAAAKAVGMSGEGGFAKLAALNQASVVTAGTKDEAGNNVVNLLAKMGSQDTAKDFKKMGINLPQQLAEGRMKGQDAIDVVGNLLQSQLGKDKNYQQAQKDLAAAKNDVERSEALKAVGDIAQGTVIGKVFQDRQALMALYAYLNARDRVTSIAENSMANPDAAQRNMDVISETTGYKTQQAGNARDIALQQSMDKMMPAIGGLADGLTNLMTQYPGYTTAVVAAAAAVTGLAGAAGLAALTLRGGASIPGLPGGGGSTAGKGGRFGGAGKAAGLAGMAWMLKDIFYTSPEEIAILEAAEARKNGGGRGKGFNDPRIIGSGANAAALEQSLRATEVKGEIFVSVVSAPGINVETSLKSNSPRIPMRGLGMTNLNAGS